MALEQNRGRIPLCGELAVVIGSGRSGKACAKLLLKNGIKVRLLEQNENNLPEDEKKLLEKEGAEIRFGKHCQNDFLDASFIIPSPGIPVANVKKLIPQSRHHEIISEMELAWRYLDNEPVIAITGTSGKTTTASLAASMLKSQGYGVFLGGNIGTPLSEYILAERKADAIVLEISSFQLQGCSTFCPRVGILLNITPNHLDYHKDMNEYTEAKFRLFRCQDEGDLAIIEDGLQNAAQNFHISARKIWLKPSGKFLNSKLFGIHNSYNMEAAWQAAKFFGVTFENAQKTVENFMPLPHRLEIVKEKNGILYINDSKCTTVSSLKAALQAFERPVLLICGGKFKGGDLTALKDLVKLKVKEVALFGASKEHFLSAWQDIVPVSWHPALKDACKKLQNSATSGDVMLLSPATSSFDLYKNYQERGEDFKNIINQIS